MADRTLDDPCRQRPLAAEAGRPSTGGALARPLAQGSRSRGGSLGGSRPRPRDGSRVRGWLSRLCRDPRPCRLPRHKPTRASPSRHRCRDRRPRKRAPSPPAQARPRPTIQESGFVRRCRHGRREGVSAATEGRGLAAQRSQGQARPTARARWRGSRPCPRPAYAVAICRPARATATEMPEAVASGGSGTRGAAAPTSCVSPATAPIG